MARAAIFLVTMLVASTLSRSALASGFTGYFGAPFCDDRGATALAARPDLQAPDAAWRQARSEACDLEDNTWRVMLRPGGAKVVAVSDDSAPVHATSALAAPPCESSAFLVTEETNPSSGAPSRVERPPRA